MRQRGLLALSLPLAAAGCLAGHAAGYAIVGLSRRDAHIHGYLGYAPQFLAVCAALVVLSLSLRVTGQLRGRAAAWPFALFAPLAFCAQELIERLVSGLPAHAVFEPPVYVGLAAQLPFAVSGYLAARALLRVADAAGQVLLPRIAGSLRPTLVPVPADVSGLAGHTISFDQLGRAPPLR
jgi:hypothetical protein